MSDEQKINLGFWEGIVLLFLGAIFGGACLAFHWWWQAAVNLLITVPFSALGLKSNRESYMLHARIEEVEKRWAQP